MAPQKTNRFLWLVFLLVACACNRLSAQVVPVSSGGKIINLSVTPQPGSIYLWKIFSDYTLKTEAPFTDARFTQSNQGPSVSVELKRTGIFFYSVTCTGPTGCTNLKVGFLENLSSVSAIAGSDQIIGYCQTATLDASASMGEISSYKWELLDPFGSLSTPNQKNTGFTISPSYQGAYPASLRVLLTVADKEGNSDKDTLIVTIDPPASADISSSGKYEKDGSMLVDGSVSKGNGLQYRWFTNEGKIIGDNTKSIAMLNGAGIYNLEVTDAHGCKSLKSFQFPIPTTSIIANNDYARTSWDQPVTIPVLENDFDPNHDLKTDILSIFEKPARGDAATNPDGTITYRNNENQSGSDQFIYQICDSEGRCATAKVKVVIEAAGVQPTEAFSPNGDNQNDYLVFKGLENYPNSQLYIYTRAGQLVYSDTNYQNNWDGKRKINNQVVPTGTYYYILKLGGTGKTIKGFVFIDY